MLSMFFSPKSVAVIGASKDPSKIGHQVLRNIIKGGFEGSIFGVNPKETEILGKPIFPSVKNIPGDLDLVVIVIPAKFVLDAVKECVEKGVRGAVIITAGFKETGKEGADVENQIRTVAKAGNMRIVGPNCLGLISSKGKLNASFVGEMATPGNVAFISQSGALCSAVLDWSHGENVGFSMFVSVGNKCDVDEADLLREFANDKGTEVIMVYAEDIHHGRAFMEVTEEVSCLKPIIALKSGRTTSGMAAISSHTGSLAGDDKAYTQAFKQPGAIRCRTIADLFNLTKAFALQPRLTGPNIAVITNAGGPGVMATDAVEDAKLTLAKLAPETTAALKGFLPAAANTHNPIDVLGDAMPDRYEFALKQVLGDPNVDAVLVILTPQSMTDVEGTAHAVGEAARGCKKPVLCSWMGGRQVAKAEEIFKQYSLPHYLYPESAVKVLQKMYTYKKRCDRPHKSWLLPDNTATRNAAASQIIADVKATGRTTLNEFEARQVMHAYGMPVSQASLAKTVDAAVSAADETGYPVVLKIVSPDILHKSDIGGVKVNLKSADEVRAAFDSIMTSCRAAMPQADIHGILVDKMLLTQNKQVIIGMKRTPNFGPMLMVGLGGIFVEILKDVSFRLVPLDRDEAKKMISEIKTYPILAGTRGEKPYDIDTLADCLVKLSNLCIDFPEIKELDINPIMLFPQGEGANGVDVKILLS